MTAVKAISRASVLTRQDGSAGSMAASLLLLPALPLSKPLQAQDASLRFPRVPGWKVSLLPVRGAAQGGTKAGCCLPEARTLRYRRLVHLSAPYERDLQSWFFASFYGIIWVEC